MSVIFEITEGRMRELKKKWGAHAVFELQEYMERFTPVELEDLRIRMKIVEMEYTKEYREFLEKNYGIFNFPELSPPLINILDRDETCHYVSTLIKRENSFDFFGGELKADQLMKMLHQLPYIISIVVNLQVASTYKIIREKTSMDYITFSKEVYPKLSNMFWRIVEYPLKGLVRDRINPKRVHIQGEVDYLIILNQIKNEM